MTTSSSNSRKLIQAAGGLLWRESAGGFELAVVHRQKYDDWSLPKGKLKGNETRLEAALREVKEETGYSPRVIGFAGAIAYQTSDGTKVVCFWHMTPQGNDRQGIFQDVDQVVWLPIQALSETLTYPLERALLEVWPNPIEISK